MGQTTVSADRRKRRFPRVMLLLFVGALVGGLLTFWYLFTPSFCDGRKPAVKFALKMKWPGFFGELDRNFHPMRRAIDLFYLKKDRMPTTEELKTLTRQSLGLTAQSLKEKRPFWERYGKNRFGQDSYYYDGYEKGECTFFVDPSEDPSELDDDFQKNILPLISGTFTELEHQMLFVDISRPLPQYFVLRPAVCSSVCLDLLDLMKDEHPDRYNEIRNELLREREEGTYEKICVFSKPFQEKLARRKEQEGQRK